MSGILLIGAAGLVGRHLRDSFRGSRVVATYHRTAALDALHLDLADPHAAAKLVDRIHPEVVVVAGAEASVERCEREPGRTRTINVEAAQAIAGSAARVGARLVVFSSEYVFDGSRGRYVEDDPVAPLNEYGRQKVALETVARSVPRHLVCRTSGAFGWEDARKNFVCQLVDTLRAGRPFRVPLDQLITPTYAPHLAAAIVRLVELETNGTVHIVGPRILSRTGFAGLVCRAFGLEERLILPRRTAELGLIAQRPHSAGLADDKLVALLGRPLPPLEDALREMRDVEGRRG